jgi:tetratricopeptide (TPR) repeat protein
MTTEPRDPRLHASLTRIAGLGQTAILTALSFALVSDPATMTVGQQLLVCVAGGALTSRIDEWLRGITNRVAGGTVQQDNTVGALLSSALAGFASDPSLSQADRAAMMRMSQRAPEFVKLLAASGDPELAMLFAGHLPPDLDGSGAVTALVGALRRSAGVTLTQDQLSRAAGSVTEAMRQANARPAPPSALGIALCTYAGMDEAPTTLHALMQVQADLLHEMQSNRLGEQFEHADHAAGLKQILEIVQKILGGLEQRPPPPVDDGPYIAQPVRRLDAATHFVRRESELRLLSDGLEQDLGAVALIGTGGVGKTYLVERYLATVWQSAGKPVVRYAYSPTAGPSAANQPSGDEDLAESLAAAILALRDMQSPPGSSAWECLAWTLHHDDGLLLIENVDTEPCAGPVIALVRRLARVKVVVTGRYQALSAAGCWSVIEMLPFRRADAEAQLSDLLGDGYRRLTASDRDGLWEALHGLPLAVTIAASHIQQFGGSASDFVRLFKEQRAAIGRAPGALADDDNESHRTLQAAVQVSIDALMREPDGSAMVPALRRLAVGPAAGMGVSLSAALSGVPLATFNAMVNGAKGLSLLSVVPADNPAVGSRVLLHPIVSEVLNDPAIADAALDAMTDWFVALLPEGGDDQGKRWRQIQGELAALERWLGAVPSARLREVERAGSAYARINGPFRWWAPLCERLIASGDADDRSHARLTLSNIQRKAGDLDAAIATAEAGRKQDTERGAEREAAIAAGMIADILQSRGELDEALRILRDEALPVYDRLGDVRERAVTMGSIADILQSRGELDEALRIRREEELPVYDRLEDVRSRAVTMGQIADILGSRGELDEALRILRDEALPDFKRLGDVRSRAVTMGKIADILGSRGELDEALRIRREEELPVYERLGDVLGAAITQRKIADVLEARGDLDGALTLLRDKALPGARQVGAERDVAVFQGRVADILQSRGELDEALRIRREEQLPVYERLGDVRERAVTMGKIADILGSRGELDEALRIRREEELPVYERLGAVRDLLVCRWWIATILDERGRSEDRAEIERLLRLALADARRLRIPEAGQIEGIMRQMGLDPEQVA